jgi:hypothetical protein
MGQHQLEYALAFIIHNAQIFQYVPEFSDIHTTIGK